MQDGEDLSLTRKLALIRRDAEERAAEKLAKREGYPYVDLRKTPIAIEAVKAIPEGDAKAAKIVGLQIKARTLALAVAEPGSTETKKIVEGLSAKGFTVKILVSSAGGIEEAWHWYGFIPSEKKKITGKIEISKEKLASLSTRLSTIQTVQETIAKLDFGTVATSEFLETVLGGILPNRVSDIHFEAAEGSAKLRFRIDGILHDIFEGIPSRTYGALLSRIKLLSGLKINVRTEAQDGRFTVGMAGKEVEMRVSIIPSEFGETVVMRVLDPDAINIELKGLGLREDNLVLVEKNLARPNGLILNTGPTGSGKTTTLYAFLRHVNSPDVKIITVEDPIEYHLKGVSQTQVNPSVGYTFASGLRSILRQDPDVILVGEIRDQETADIAMQASLTGHLVFSTLHTNDAVGAVPRLIDLGVKSATIGPALTVVIAQRLVRRLCAYCKKEAPSSKELAAKIEAFLKHLPKRVNPEPYKPPKVYEAGGCKECNHFGYKGRIAIYEFLETGGEFEELILKEVSEATMKAFAETQEMITMQQDGILKILLGITTVKEVEATTGPLVW